MAGSSSTMSSCRTLGWVVTAPAVTPLASPITSTCSGSSVNCSGSREHSTWVGMSVVVDASTLPLLASQMFSLSSFWATVTTLDSPSR